MITELFQNFKSGKHLYSDYNHFTELIEMMCLTNENTAILRNKRRILFFVNYGCDIEAQPYTAVQTRFMTCPYGCMSVTQDVRQNGRQHFIISDMNHAGHDFIVCVH